MGMIYQRQETMGRGCNCLGALLITPYVRVLGDRSSKRRAGQGDTMVGCQKAKAWPPTRIWPRLSTPNALVNSAWVTATSAKADLFVMDDRLYGVMGREQKPISNRPIVAGHIGGVNDVLKKTTGGNMDQLIALPIKGESFLLRRGDKLILVDGGYNSRSLVATLTKVSFPIPCLDIVVCTHADIDHAGGLVGLLGMQKVKEFWLPAAWLGSLGGLLSQPSAVLQKLMAQMEAFHHHMLSAHRDVHGKTETTEDGTELEQYLKAFLADDGAQASPRGDAMPEEDPAEPTRLKEYLSAAWARCVSEAAMRHAFSNARRSVHYRRKRGRMAPDIASYCLQLISTAQCIRKIIVQCIQNKVPIRWFDFDLFAQTRQTSGGEPGLLLPLNAQELRSIPPAPSSFLFMLSKANTESLVFYSPTSQENPFALGVVFTGDSPLGDGPQYARTFLNSTAQPGWFVVATAPHHGSESNKVAYSHLDYWGWVVLWLRTGGSKRHPGATYQEILPCLRACTHCPQSNLALRSVVVGLDWSESHFPHFCCCKSRR